MPNRWTPLYSKIYYKEENYLKVRTVVFKYITPPIVKFGTSVCCTSWVHHISIYWVLCTYWVPIIWLGYPSSYGFTGSISPASCVLILIYLRSYLRICTILFIRSIIPTPSFISLSLKNLISKLLIRGVLCSILI